MKRAELARLRGAATVYALDLDGVLADFNHMYRNRFKKALSPNAGISQPEWHAINAEHLFATMPALAGAATVAKSQLNGSSQLYFLSSRSYAARDDTLEWLKRNNLELYNADHLILTAGKVGKIFTLHEMTSTHGWEVAFLDDDLPTVALADGLDDVYAGLMFTTENAPYAHYFPRIRTVSSVAEFLRNSEVTA